MARRPQCRRIGAYPDCWLFSPEDGAAETVLLSLDEYECIRLLDREGLTQEQSAQRMGVGRTTVTAIYDSARKKIAEALVEGKALRIGGGNYSLPEQVPENVPEKGNSMRIAVCYENGEIFQHFGHTAQFKLYDVQDGNVLSSRVVDTNGSGHGALAGFLKAAQVDALICGGIGMGARNALAEAGIRLYGGVKGSADAAALALAKGILAYDPNAKCDHHDHHGEDHDCGSHSGTRSCGGSGEDRGCVGHSGRF